MLTFLCCLLSQLASDPKPVATVQPTAPLEGPRKAYREDAENYRFFAGGEGRQALALVPQPIMRWSSSDDWSGDVFLWTFDKRPAVVGCILSGPADGGTRLVFQEFHLLSEQPIGAADLQHQRHWKPKVGLTLQAVPEAPVPAKTAAGRLTQMRQMSREFTAYMKSDSDWELRSLPQPLFRYGDESTPVLDGALFCYVWTKGTDPEVILLLECRQNAAGLSWQYAPIRFSNRPVWLKYHEKEVWRVDNHGEPAGNETDLIYTTSFAGTLPRPMKPEQPKSAP